MSGTARQLLPGDQLELQWDWSVLRAGQIVSRCYRYVTDMLVVVFTFPPNTQKNRLIGSGNDSMTIHILKGIWLSVLSSPAKGESTGTCGFCEQDIYRTFRPKFWPCEAAGRFSTETIIQVKKAVQNQFYSW
jgi:hypothetical protein